MQIICTSVIWSFFWVYRAQYLQKLSLFTFSDLNNTENLQMTLFYLYRRNQRKTNKYRFTASLWGRSNLWHYCFRFWNKYFQNWSTLDLKCLNLSKCVQKCSKVTKLVQIGLDLSKCVWNYSKGPNKFQIYFVQTSQSFFQIWLHLFFYIYRCHLP